MGEVTNRDAQRQNKVDEIVLVTENSQEYLNPKQEIAYREHRRELAEWLLNLGKNPNEAEGYSYSTAKNRMNRLDLFYRFVWDREDRYVQDLTTDHADAWMRWLAKKDYKESTKCHYQKAAHTYFKWKRWERGTAAPTPSGTPTSNTATHPPRTRPATI